MSWTTFDEYGNVKEINVNNEFSPSYENIKFIEENTNYEFTTGQKLESITNGVIDEAKQTATSFDNVFSNIGAGVKNGAILLKYAPFVIGAYYLYKMTNKRGKGWKTIS